MATPFRRLPAPDYPQSLHRMPAQAGLRSSSNFLGGALGAKPVVQGTGKPPPPQVNVDASNSVISIPATVDASLIQSPGVAAVNTLNPHSGSTDNGLSNTINFIINPSANKLPTLNSITPNAIGAGSTNISVTLAGQDFLPTAGTCTGTN